jgi:hypothetical protein
MLVQVSGAIGYSNRVACAAALLAENKLITSNKALKKLFISNICKTKCIIRHAKVVQKTQRAKNIALKNT